MSTVILMWNHINCLYLYYKWIGHFWMDVSHQLHDSNIAEFSIRQVSCVSSRWSLFPAEDITEGKIFCESLFVMICELFFSGFVTDVCEGLFLGIPFCHLGICYFRGPQECCHFVKFYDCKWVQKYELIQLVVYY